MVNVFVFLGETTWRHVEFRSSHTPQAKRPFVDSDPITQLMFNVLSHMCITYQLAPRAHGFRPVYRSPHSVTTSVKCWQTHDIPACLAHPANRAHVSILVLRFHMCVRWLFMWFACCSRPRFFLSSQSDSH